MLKYLIKDLWNTLQYLPYMLVAGTLVCIVAFMTNYRRKQKGRETENLFLTICFYTYLALVLILTFLSREGSTNLRIDLQIGSSLGINSRNDAYILENILLFVPYGVLIQMYFKKQRGVVLSLISGFFTSLVIELLQLVTRRGIFQIDDIITNTLGCVIGFVIFKCFKFIRVPKC